MECVYLQDVELYYSISIFVEGIKSSCNEQNKISWISESYKFRLTLQRVRKSAKTLCVCMSRDSVMNRWRDEVNPQAAPFTPVLTEHALQSHEAADVTVKVDVEAFVSVTHGDDVIQLFVEV